VNGWVWFRLTAIAFVIVAGCFVPLGPRASPPLDWGVLGIIFAFCPIAMVIVFGIQRVNPRSAKVWHRPSWATNPFNFRDPVQFFYLGAILSAAQGLIIVLRIVVTSFPFYVEALVPLAMGLGAWVGVKAIVVVYRSKFEPDT
jgi:hypothetical protein